MSAIINYVSFVFTKIVEILDSINLPGSISALQYFLGIIIIALIFRVIKGGTTEFEQNTNFLNGRIISSSMSKYGMSNKVRQAQLVSNSTLEKKKTYVVSSSDLEKNRQFNNYINNTSPSERAERWRNHGVSEVLIQKAFEDD